MTALAAGVARDGAASALRAVLAPLLGGELPVRLRAWDGSEAGPADGPVVVLRSRRSLRRLLYHPSELGLAQAYVTGELDVVDDLGEALHHLRAHARAHRLTAPPVDVALLRSALGTAGRLGALGPPPRAPASQARLRGRRHSPGRDRAAIRHHYDLGNDFYALILDPSMSYSCAYWTQRPSPGYTLAEAQRDKLDLVAHKLDVQPGSRHLDIGCGWGALSLHLAEHYEANVLAVTLSRQQQAFVQARVAERGLTDRVEIRLQDYREVPEHGFDSITAIEMGEHVGAAGYPAFAAMLAARLRAQGRVLIQQMSRRSRPGGGAFIEAYIAPDMHMRPVGETVSLIEDGGLEVRDVHALREHYVLTVKAWYDEFERRAEQVRDLVGEELMRVWRLYLVGGMLAFEEGRMGVDQILAVRACPAGVSGMPQVR